MLMSNTCYEWNPAQYMEFLCLMDYLNDLGLDEGLTRRTVDYYDAQRRDVHTDPERVLNRLHLKIQKLEQRAKQGATAQGETSDYQPEGINRQTA